MLKRLHWLITHTVYKLRTHGLSHIPAQGGGMIVSNHISPFDTFILLFSLKRPVRFMMYRRFYELPFLRYLWDAMRVIPVAYDDGPKAIAASLETARASIVAGDLVAIFPETALTKAGTMMAFSRGFERVMRDTNAPIIPVYFDNVWGSLFNLGQSRLFLKRPRLFTCPVSVVVGAPLASTAQVHEVRIAVQELGAEACRLRGRYRKKLHMMFIETVRRYPFRLAASDATGRRLSFSALLTAAFLFKGKIFGGPHLAPRVRDSSYIGIMLPASCAGVIATWAVYASGKIPVHLNFTLSKDALESCIAQTKMTIIITSRQFLEKAGLPARSEMVYAEDLAGGISALERLAVLASVLLFPASVLKRLFVDGNITEVDDTATVIFSSGSTGEPKGVVLSHANIFSNVEGFYRLFDITGRDVVMGTLPLFHSFGFTATLCFPNCAGIPAAYYPNPTDAAGVGASVQKNRGTILIGTPTFLGTYLRRCTQEQFASVRIVVSGAEKLRPELARAFREKFGVMPFEGYGATELSPIVSVGCHDEHTQHADIMHIGFKPGTVGHPIPGVAAKVVDPETGEILPYGTPGLLLIKGPNVMRGYLHQPELTAQVMRKGWYVTGDIAMIDHDGFITITDRLSRFSKIGGEMVPHAKVEEAITELLGETESTTIAVTSVPDETKGERLAVLHLGELDISWIVAALAKKGLPNLWIPKKNMFFRVDAIPVLGSGKRDLKGIKEAAKLRADGVY